MSTSSSVASSIAAINKQIASLGKTVGVSSSSSSSGSSNWMSSGGGSDVSNMLIPPKQTTLTDYSITSQQDIAADVNAAMQALVGRNATEQEIQTLGAELIAAQRANPTIVTQTTNRDSSGMAVSLTGGTTSTGVNAQSFLQNLIAGTGQAKQFKVATGYFDAMTAANSKFTGAYNG